MKSLVSASFRLICKHSNSYVNVAVSVAVDIKLLILCTKVWKSWRHKLCLMSAYVCVCVSVYVCECVHAYFNHIPILWKNKHKDISRFIFYCEKKWSIMETDWQCLKNGMLCSIPLNFLTWTIEVSQFLSLSAISMCMSRHPAPSSPYTRTLISGKHADLLRSTLCSHHQSCEPRQDTGKVSLVILCLSILTLPERTPTLKSSLDGPCAYTLLAVSSAWHISW